MCGVGPPMDSCSGPPGVATVDPRQKAAVVLQALQWTLAGELLRVPGRGSGSPPVNPCWRTAVVSWAWRQAHTKKPHRALQDEWQNSPYQQPCRGSHAPLQNPQAGCSLEGSQVPRVPRNENGEFPGEAADPRWKAAMGLGALQSTLASELLQSPRCGCSRPPPVRIRGLRGMAAEPHRQSAAGLWV